MKEIYFLVSEEKGKTRNDSDQTVSPRLNAQTISLNLINLFFSLSARSPMDTRRWKPFEACKIPGTLLATYSNWDFHSAATLKVSQALVELQKLEQDLKRLRTRVAMPMLPNEPSIPLQLHIENLRKGVEVLTQGKLMAKRREDQVIEQMTDRRKYPRLGSI